MGSSFPVHGRRTPADDNGGIGLSPDKRLRYVETRTVSARPQAPAKRGRERPSDQPVASGQRGPFGATRGEAGQLILATAEWGARGEGNQFLGGRPMKKNHLL